MSTRRIIDMSVSDLEEKLLGQRIVQIDTDRNIIQLGDGTALEFEDTSDCCAWFSAKLETGALTENAVTNVTTTDDSESDEGYRIHILAVDTEIGSIAIDGYSGSGYYCASVNLVIHAPKEAN